MSALWHQTRLSERAQITSCAAVVSVKGMRMIKVLVDPSLSKITISPYTTLAKDIEYFIENKIPFPFDIDENTFNDGSGIEETLRKNSCLSQKMP